MAVLPGTIHALSLSKSFGKVSQQIRSCMQCNIMKSFKSESVTDPVFKTSPRINFVEDSRESRSYSSSKRYNDSASKACIFPSPPGPIHTT